VKVSGVEIDWERQVPENQEDPFYPSFEPAYVTPPNVIAPPPARVETTEPIAINPLIDHWKRNYYSVVKYGIEDCLNGSLQSLTGEGIEVAGENAWKT